MKFQWSKVASVLGSYQDFIKSYHLSISAAGFSNEQIEAQLNTINRRFEQLKATVTGIATGMGASGLSAYIKNILVSLNSFAQALQRIPTSTYEMIGAIVKWGAALGGALLVIRRLVAGVIGMQSAYRTFVATQALETAATEASTASKVRNTLARIAGVTAARTQATATVTATSAIVAETAATEAATVATGAWAVVMGAAGGALNLIIGIIAAAGIAFALYNTKVDEAAEAQGKLKQSSEDLIAIEQQKLDMTKKEADFVETLIRAHFKLAEQVDNTSNSEEKNAQIKRDLQATDQKLTEIIGEDGLKRIKSSKDVQSAVKAEQEIYREKAEKCVQNMIESAKAEREYTRQSIQAAVDRVDALKSETQAWGAWARAKQAAMNVYAGLAEGQMKSATYQMSIHEAGSPEYERASQQLKVWQNERDWASNWKPGEVTGELAQLEQTIAELNGKLAKQDLNIAGMELNLAQIQRNGLNGLPTDETDSGEVAEEAGKGGTDKKGRAPSERAGAKKADNSPMAMSFRYLQSKGLDTNFIAGLLGNAIRESGGWDLNPDADNGSHRGLFQWSYNDASRSGRWYDFIDDYLANRGISESKYWSMGSDQKRTLQLDFAQYEMMQGKEQRAYQNIVKYYKPMTPEEWASAINQEYERSGEAAGSPIDYERQKNARDVFESYGSSKNGELNYVDGEKALSKNYDTLKKMYDERIKQMEFERANTGQKISANERLSIYKEIMGITDNKNPFATSKKAINDYRTLLIKVIEQERKRGEATDKATDTQVSAIEKMADAEVEFTEKLGLFNKQDVRNYQYRKNEQNYASRKPLLDYQLGNTVDLSKGTAADILKAYRGLIDAENELEAKHYANKIFWLSRDVDATKKALDEELKLEEKYQQERYRIERENFEYKNRYTLNFIDNVSTEFSNGLNDMLTKAKSFGEALRDIFKNIGQSIIKEFTDDIGKRMKKWLSNLIFKRTDTGRALGTNHSKGKEHFNLMEWGMSNLPLLGGGKGKKSSKGGLNLMNLFGGSGGFFGLGKGSKGNNPFLEAMGLTKNLGAQAKALITPVTYTLRNTMQNTFAGISNIATQGMNTISAGVNIGTQAMSTTWQGYKLTQVGTELAGNATIVASSESTAATVQASTAQMMGWIMAVLALFSLFAGGGGGESKSESTSSVNLGRSPDSYYMTPTPVMQSTTFNVPSFDIGGNIEQDMFAMVHKGEMVLTPEQADVIRNTARTGGSMGSGGNASASVKSNINVSTVDSRGFDRVLRDYSRDLSKNIKKSIRNGYLNAKGLV